MGKGKFSGKPNELQGANLAMDWHLIQGGAVRLLVTTGNQEKLGPFDLSTDFNFFSLPELFQRP